MDLPIEHVPYLNHILMELARGKKVQVTVRCDKTYITLEVSAKITGSGAS